jgi:hypothetical protein
MTRVLGTGDKWEGRYGTLGNGVGENAIPRALARVMIAAASVHDIFGTVNKGYLEANAVAYITVYIAHDPKEDTEPDNDWFANTAVPPFQD